MNKNKWNFGHLVYPEALEQDAAYGHYMLFYAYSSPATQYYESFAQDTFTRAAGINIDKSKQAEFNPRLNRSKNRIEESGSLKTQLGYKKTSDAIALYMPPDVKFSYKTDYRNTETAFAGLAASMGIDAANNIPDQSTISDILNQVGGTATDVARSVLSERVLKQGGAYIADLLGGGDTAATVNLIRSKALNPHLEAVFEKVDFRTFNYTFRFTPKNENEVRTVHAIINSFKFHMMPERQVDRYGSFLKFPSEFEIHFMYKGSENTWLPFISHCVLNSVDVDYGGVQFQTFRPIRKPSPSSLEGGNDGEAPPPATIVMTLSFTESEIMTKEKIIRGF